MAVTNDNLAAVSKCLPQEVLKMWEGSGLKASTEIGAVSLPKQADLKDILELFLVLL